MTGAPRTRPSAQDREDAEDLRWFDAHADLFHHAGGKVWEVYRTARATKPVARLEGIHEAIRVARRMQETREREKAAE